MTIVIPEQSRKTKLLVTLPYTVNVIVGLKPPSRNRGSQQDGFGDASVVMTGLLETDDGTDLTGYAQATFQELGPTAAVETDYGSGDPNDTDQFSIYDGKLFGGILLSGRADYFYVDYSEGVNSGSIPWTRSTSVVDLGFSDHGPLGVVMPVVWEGLTKPFVLFNTVDRTTNHVRALLVSESGETDVAKLCVIPDTSMAAPFDYADVDFIIPDPDAGKNWFLSRFFNNAHYLVGWNADTSGNTLSSDLVQFAASDVQVNICDNPFAGYWLITPDYFIYYVEQSVWQSFAFETIVDVGIVVVKIAKDLSSYEVEFLQPAPGDAAATSLMDSPTREGLVINADGKFFYFDPRNDDSAGTILYEGHALIDTPDLSPRFPDSVALAATGGPGFKTSIAPLDRGSRFKEWQRVRGRYEISQLLKDQDQLDALLTFFRARRGRAFPFRFKDWSDYQLPDPGSGNLFVDVFVTNVTGGTIQLTKTYQDVIGGYVRTITRPVVGTVKLYDDGVLTTDFTVDLNTGIITLGSALEATSGHVISVACEFDVWARFDTDVMSVSVKNLEVYDWQNVAIVELKDG